MGPGGGDLTDYFSLYLNAPEVALRALEDRYSHKAFFRSLTAAFAILTVDSFWFVRSLSRRAGICVLLLLAILTIGSALAFWLQRKVHNECFQKLWVHQERPTHALHPTAAGDILRAGG